MKIGDRVRFLSDVGGGVIKGFQNKNKIVLVEDEDGFQVPVLASEVVVISTDDYNIAKVDTLGRNQQATKPDTRQAVPQKEAISSPMPDEDEEMDLADVNITYKPKPEERANGDKLSVYLAFVPVEPKEFSTSAFECYIINDCNYFVNYVYLSKENSAFTLRRSGEIAPNTKVFIEEIDRTMLNDLERVAVQLIAYKQDKPFLLKTPVSVELKIDSKKFFKYHAFGESIFFDDPTLEFSIVKDDVPEQTYTFNPKDIQVAMTEKGDIGNKWQDVAKVSKKSNVREIIEVDLHAGELLSTTAGMSAGDIKEYQLNVFRKTMNEHLKHKGQKIVFIHGKGEGALRSAILSELKRKYPACPYQDASFQQYGFGATMVTIR